MSVWVFLIVCVVCATICRVLGYRVRERTSRYGTDETELIQEIHHGLQRMEERVEALETLLMDNARTQRAYSELD